jgi:transposase
MWNIGLDVHQRETQVCILTPEGEVTEHRLPTTRARLTAYFAPLPPSRLLLESSTESEWVAQRLEGLGHTVLVADPSFAPMYGRRRRTKTDRRDARALAEACAHGVYRLAHRLSARQREVRLALAVRQSLVRTRTRWINGIRGRLRAEGLRLARGTPTTFGRRVQALGLPTPLLAQLTPLLTLLPTLTTAIAEADQQLATWAGQDPIARTLQSVPGVGPLTALAFIAALDDITRFPTAREVPAYLGLVPRERSSGDTVHRGGISKAGHAQLRWLLVEAAWRVLRSPDPRHAALRAWGERVAQRRGRRIAVVAVARRLARILYALWRDAAVYGVRPTQQAA